MAKKPKLYTIRPLEWRANRFGMEATTPMYDYTIERRPYTERQIIMKNSVFLAEADDKEQAFSIASSDYSDSISECLLPFKLK